MKMLTRSLAAAVLALGAGQAAQAAETLKMATIAPGSSAYLTMTTMAKLVNGGQQAYDIQVDATGAATKHLIELAQGKLDICMTSPTVHSFMKSGTRMYKKLKNAPELSEKIRLMFWFPYGSYHVLAYADSGINSLKDIKGKKVFLGPPGGGAWATANQWITATTGYKVNEDFENVKASWSSAFQGFQDRQFDVYVNGGIPPFPQVEQLSQTSKIRILGLTKAEVDAASPEMLKPTKIKGRKMGVIKAGTYGPGVVNTEDIYTVDSVVGVAVRHDLPDDTVYAITKAFWEQVEKNRASTPWLNRITLEYAVQDGGLELHPGAARYYEEIGIKIPDGSCQPCTARKKGMKKKD